jgi:hypothetical protein
MHHPNAAIRPAWNNSPPCPPSKSLEKDHRKKEEMGAVAKS